MGSPTNWTASLFSCVLRIQYSTEDQPLDFQQSTSTFVPEPSLLHPQGSSTHSLSPPLHSDLVTWQLDPCSNATQSHCKPILRSLSHVEVGPLTFNWTLNSSFEDAGDASISMIDKAYLLLLQGLPTPSHAVFCRTHRYGYTPASSPRDSRIIGPHHPDEICATTYIRL